MKQRNDTPGHAAILAALGSKRLPDKFVVPPDLYTQFCAEMEDTGHANTVWGRPVESGNVTKVVLVYNKPIQRKKPWWLFWQFWK